MTPPHLRPCSLALALVLGGCDLLRPPLQEPEARAVAQAWLDQLDGQPFNVTLTAKERGLFSTCFYATIPPCPDPRAASHLADEGQPGDTLPTQLSIGFEADITPDSPLSVLQASLRYVALDALPIPALAAKGWEITPVTPISSFSEGISLTGYDGHRLQAAVETGFSGIAGHSTAPECAPVPDGPAAPGCAFFIEAPLQGQIGLDLPVFTPPAHAD